MTTLDTTSLSVGDAIEVTEPVASAPASMTVSSDGTLFIGAGDLLTAIAAGSGARVRSWEATGPISGLSLSNSGERLFVVQDGRIEVLDAATTKELGETSLPDLGAILSVAAIG
jgi:hypothetical protein